MHLPRRAILLITLAKALGAQGGVAPVSPPGTVVDIGGQTIQVDCTGRGQPTVILESGTMDPSVIWALVQPSVSQTARVCSYDRAGYAWSQPGALPRSFSQLALELRTALERLGEPPPYVLVGQSFGGGVVRGFAARYPHDIAGMVLVDAVHEDQHIVYGGAPHRIRDEARGRTAPAPRIALDTGLIAAARRMSPRTDTALLPAPLDRLPLDAQARYRWALAQPTIRLEAQLETEWSPEEMRRMHEERATNRTTLGALPLIVLARASGGFPPGLSISADSLERERRNLQADLARLSSIGELRFVQSGHNIHVERPEAVITAINDVLRQARRIAR